MVNGQQTTPRSLRSYGDRSTANEEASERTGAFFEADGARLAAEAAEAANPTNFQGQTREELVAAADEFIEHSKFGEYGGEFGRPFSRQFKKAVRAQFGAYDGATFDAVDASEASSWRIGIRIRFYTYLLFVLAGAFYFGATAAVLGHEKTGAAARGGLLALPAAFGAVVLALAKNISLAVATVVGMDMNDGPISPIGYGAGVVLFFAAMYGLRSLIRNVMIDALEKNVSKLASAVIKGVTNLNTQIQNAVKASYDRGDAGTDWPRVSGEWVKIALWIDQRYEYVDRYVSLAAWRVENAFSMISFLFRSLNIATAVFFITSALSLVARAPTEAMTASRLAFSGVVSVIYFIFAVFIWSFFNLRKDSFWKEKFSENFGDFDKDRVHIFDDIRRIVERDKRDKVQAEIGR